MCAQRSCAAQCDPNEKRRSAAVRQLRSSQPPPRGLVQAMGRTSRSPHLRPTRKAKQRRSVSRQQGTWTRQHANCLCSEKQNSSNTSHRWQSGLELAPLRAPSPPAPSSSRRRGTARESCPRSGVLLIISRKLSCLTWESVKKTGLPPLVAPSIRYSDFMSSLKSSSLYVRVSLIWNSSYSATAAARRVKDCLPEPPTPTSNKLPRVVFSTRWIRHKCSRASGKGPN